MTRFAPLRRSRLSVDANAVARRAAEQLIDGHAERLAFDVPHRDVHGRERARQDDVAAVEGLAVDGLPVVCGLARVFADQIPVELFDRGYDGLDAALDGPFTDTDDAGVGVHLDEDRAQRVDRDDLDPGDLDRRSWIGQRAGRGRGGLRCADEPLARQQAGHPGGDVREPLTSRYGRDHCACFRYFVANVYATHPIGAASAAPTGPPAGAAAGPAPRPRPLGLPPAPADTACRPFVHRGRADEVAAEARRPELLAGVAVPCTNLVVTSGAKHETRFGDNQAIDVPGTPVPVMPRAASAGSSPKPMRHLIAGWFRSYFTIVVYGGLMRLPTVLYSLIV